MTVTFADLGHYGRFGNQLWQIASTIGLALSNGHDFCFPVWEHDRHFSHTLLTDYLTSFRTYTEPEPYYHDVILSQQFDWNLKGYFQSYKYFDHCRPTIHYVLDFPKKHRDGVAVHVRRGDYLSLAHIHPVLTTEYYISAMQYFEGETFTIFSDDIEWCKNYLKGWNISYHSSEGDIEDFKIMSGFENFIIANSSYSWWAAYLSRSTRVVAPKQWVLTETRNDRLLPEWMQI
jgi:hypothetical protein